MTTQVTYLLSYSFKSWAGSELAPSIKGNRPRLFSNLHLHQPIVSGPNHLPFTRLAFSTFTVDLTFSAEEAREDQKSRQQNAEW